MIGREICLQSRPQRIVSLVPSQTELLYDLGLEEKVIGITKFCVHPEQWFRSKSRVGGTKSVHIGKVATLRPDLIIANKEENTKADIDALRHIAPVWTSDIINFEDSLSMIRHIGTITGTYDKAAALVRKLKNDLLHLPLHHLAGRTVAYFIWHGPLMVAAQNTFVNDILCRLGFRNAFEHKMRYPETDQTELQLLRPDYILLSSEPFPFKEKHIAAFERWLPDAKIMLVDGEMFSWYGSRLQHAMAYFRTLFLPNLAE